MVGSWLTHEVLTRLLKKEKSVDHGKYWQKPEELSGVAPFPNTACFADISMRHPLHSALNFTRRSFYLMQYKITSTLRSPLCCRCHRRQRCGLWRCWSMSHLSLRVVLPPTRTAWEGICLTYLRWPWLKIGGPHRARKYAMFGMAPSTFPAASALRPKGTSQYTL